MPRKAKPTAGKRSAVISLTRNSIRVNPKHARVGDIRSAIALGAGRLTVAHRLSARGLTLVAGSMHAAAKQTSLKKAAETITGALLIYGYDVIRVRR